MGTETTYTGHKPIGAPTLRRDPTGHKKLKMVHIWTEQCVKECVEAIGQLAVYTKRQLLRVWH